MSVEIEKKTVPAFFFLSQFPVFLACHRRYVVYLHHMSAPHWATSVAARRTLMTRARARSLARLHLARFS